MLLAACPANGPTRPPSARSLEDLAARDGNASPAYLRLMELEEAAGDWPALTRDARRLLAINPLIPAPYRQLGRAAEQLGRSRPGPRPPTGPSPCSTTTDPADVHYRLAKLLQPGREARRGPREVLKSLEEAPRFLDAHRLLLELVESAEAATRPQPRPRGPDP